MTTGMIGRKLGMMRLYDGGGRSRGVTVIELGPNYVTQLRTPERDGYAAVQMGFPGRRKRVNRPERGHLRKAGLDNRPAALTKLREFRVDDPGEFTVGQELRCDRFEAGTFVDVTATSKGKGFAGGVKRHHFAGGPKTHGQSDRHRAPGSIGSGTTPGRVFKGLRMAGHMGDVTSTVLNLLVVAVDPTRNLIFVEGSVPGPRTGIVTVRGARRPALKSFAAPEIPGAAVDAEIEAADAVDEAEEAEAIEEPTAEVAETETAEATETAEKPAAEAAAEAPEASDDAAADAAEKSEASS